MSHLDIIHVLSVLNGNGSSADHSHLEECASCRRDLDSWRPRLSDLRDLETNAVEASELHNLRVLFRQLGPASIVRSWVARLIRGPKLAVESVRGGLEASLGAYQAGPYEIVVQIRPSSFEGRFDVHGQVMREDGMVPESTHVVLTSLDGHVDRAELDRFGEFQLAAVPAGPIRMVWFAGDSRIDLEELAVGGPNEDADR
jgi:hypothetical protein